MARRPTRLSRSALMTVENSFPVPGHFAMSTPILASRVAELSLNYCSATHVTRPTVLLKNALAPKNATILITVDLLIERSQGVHDVIKAHWRTVWHCAQIGCWLDGAGVG